MGTKYEKSLTFNIYAKNGPKSEIQIIGIWIFALKINTKVCRYNSSIFQRESLNTFDKSAILAIFGMNWQNAI